MNSLLAVVVAFTTWQLTLVTAFGQGPPPRPEPTASSPAEAVKPTDPLGRDTPRSSITAYYAAMRAGDLARAAQYLDLRRIPSAMREAQGPALARQLKVVLDQNLWIDPELLSDDAEGRRDDGLPRNVEHLAKIETQKGPVDLLLERVPNGGVSVWKVSAGTVNRVASLYEEFGRGPLADFLPAQFFDIRVLDIALWQWVALLLLLTLTYVLSWLIVLGGQRLVRPLVTRSRSGLDDHLLSLGVGPIRLGVWLLLFAAGTLFLDLAIPVMRTLGEVERTIAVIAVIWLLIRAVDVLGELATMRLIARGHLAAISMVPLGRKTVKVVLGALGFVAILQNAGVNVTGILAGLGVGGLAVALAAQKTIENLFGGIALTVDQPIRIGDVCRFGNTSGVVEEIGMRSTRVRTAERTIVTVPNSVFSGLELENLSKRDRICLTTTLRLRCETTPDQLRWVVVELRKLLYAHPKISPDGARARFIGFGPSSLDVEVFAYVTTASYDEFLAVREDIYLRVMDLVEAGGTALALPSQMSYAGGEASLDEGKGHAAEATVRAWRERGEMYFPEFSREQIESLNGTLEYPPKASATGDRAA